MKGKFAHQKASGYYEHDCSLQSEHSTGDNIKTRSKLNNLEILLSFELQATNAAHFINPGNNIPKETDENGWFSKSRRLQTM